MNANTENEIGFWLPYGVFIFGVVMMFTGIQPDGYIVFSSRQVGYLEEHK